jgi:putative transposase
MSHSLVKLWTHAVFSTKDRMNLIIPAKEKEIHNYIKSLLYKDLGCPWREINGTTDHLHLLFLQNPEKSIAEIIKHVKGSSSHWINQQNFIQSKFAWQVGYGAFSVSESLVDKITNYIADQKKHHKQFNYDQEMEQLNRLYFNQHAN